MPNWLEDPRCIDVDLFVSRSTLKRRKRLPVACTDWALDSGGFTELQLHGQWTLSPREYAAEVRRFRDEIGRLIWAAPQDWMCEPQVTEGLVKKRKPSNKRTSKINLAQWLSWARGAGPVMAKSVALAELYGDQAEIVFHGTGLSIEEHQRRTVANFLELRSVAPDLPFIPVLQGWSLYDYWRCEDLYRKAGVDLRAEPLVGVGTVCRRQGTNDATLIMRSLAASGLKLHGFGFKVLGLRASINDLASADSLAWSKAAREDAPLPGHDKPGPGRRTGHINCANCLEYALAWRARLFADLADRAPVRAAQQVWNWAAE